MQNSAKISLRKKYFFDFKKVKTSCFCYYDIIYPLGNYILNSKDVANYFYFNVKSSHFYNYRTWMFNVTSLYTDLYFACMNFALNLRLIMHYRHYISAYNEFFLWFNKGIKMFLLKKKKNSVSFNIKLPDTHKKMWKPIRVVF